MMTTLGSSPSTAEVKSSRDDTVVTLPPEPPVVLRKDDFSQVYHMITFCWLTLRSSKHSQRWQLHWHRRAWVVPGRTVKVFSFDSARKPASPYTKANCAVKQSTKAAKDFMLTGYVRVECYRCCFVGNRLKRELWVIQDKIVSFYTVERCYSLEKISESFRNCWYIRWVVPSRRHHYTRKW